MNDEIPEVQNEIQRAAEMTLIRLKRETVMAAIDPICNEEWQCCINIIEEEMEKLLKQ